MIFINNDYAYKFKPIQADWSEEAVEYTIYYLGSVLKSDQCEEHLVEKYVKEDIKKHKLEKK